MKYLVVIAVLAIGWFVWRKQRERQAEARRRAAPPASSGAGAATPQAMVRCPVCALHLPEADAVQGRQAAYCSEGHRRQAEE